MPTKQKLFTKTCRAVPSNAHDARKTGTMVACIENVGVGLITVRPAKWRTSLSISVDHLWSMLVKADVLAKKAAKAKARKERAKGGR
jgi:hypothetical protein